MSRFTSFCSQWFRWVLIAPSILPLMYIDGLMYPYLTPKTLLMRACGLIAAALFAYLTLAGEPFFWRRLLHKITWIPAALLVVAYVTSFVGLDFYRSFWSTFERGDGLLTLTVLVGLFYFTLLVANEKFFNTLSNVVAWTASIAAVYGILQWLQQTSGVNLPIITEQQGRLGGTLGNAAFLASYLTLTFFITLAALREKGVRFKRTLQTGAVLQALVVFLTATRGSYIAFGLVILGTLVYTTAFAEGKWRNYSRGSLAALLLLAVLFFAFRSELKQVPFEPIQRVASISLTDGTVSSRLYVWQQVGNEALKTPLAGVGAEHIAEQFDKIYDPSAIVEQWFDRTHNSYLDYFAQFGVGGFVFYCALVAAFGFTGWRLWREGHPKGVYLFLFAIAYAVQNFFVFDTSITLWLLLAFFALSVAVRSQATATELRIPSPRTAKQTLGGIIALAILYFLIPVSINPLRANMTLADAYLYHVADVTHSIQSLKEGYALGTYADLEYGYEAYQMYTGEQLTMLSGADRLAAYQEAKDILEKNYATYPYDARTATYLAHVLDSAPPEVSIDNSYLETVLAHDIELSPKREQPWFIKANIFIRGANSAQSASAKADLYNKAIEVLKEYVTLVPKLAEPRYVIANLYLAQKDLASAKEWADGALPLYAPDPTAASRAVKYYIAIEDWANASRFLEDIIAANPEDFDSMYDLAKTSYLSGNITRAKALVAELRAEKPGFVESDQAFLQALEK